MRLWELSRALLPPPSTPSLAGSTFVLATWLLSTLTLLQTLGCGLCLRAVRMGFESAVSSWLESGHFQVRVFSGSSPAGREVPVPDGSALFCSSAEQRPPAEWAGIQPRAHS